MALSDGNHPRINDSALPPGTTVNEIDRFMHRTLARLSKPQTFSQLQPILQIKTRKNALLAAPLISWGSNETFRNKLQPLRPGGEVRSEERRVGKECRSRW